MTAQGPQARLPEIRGGMASAVPLAQLSGSLGAHEPQVENGCISVPPTTSLRTFPK